MKEVIETQRSEENSRDEWVNGGREKKYKQIFSINDNKFQPLISYKLKVISWCENKDFF